MPRFILLSFFLLVACVPATEIDPAKPAAPQPGADPETVAALVRFETVINRIGPVAEAECKARTQRAKCRFIIAVDASADEPPNAYQTLQRNGRPVIALTLGLVANARNQDELAFILGHEAAHHIKGHLPVVRAGLLRGGLSAAITASQAGQTEKQVQQAMMTGALTEISGFTREFELEADSLGAVIAHRAGFDAVRGAAYFSRIKDPGNAFLATHPPNAQRIAIVHRTIAGL